MSLNIIIDITGALLSRNLKNTLKNRAINAEKALINKNLNKAKEQELSSSSAGQDDQLNNARRKRIADRLQQDRLQQKPAASNPVKPGLGLDGIYDVPVVATWFFSDPVIPSNRRFGGTFRSTAIQSIDFVSSSPNPEILVNAATGFLDGYVDGYPYVYADDYFVSGNRGSYARSDTLLRDNSILQGFQFSKQGSWSKIVYDYSDPGGAVEIPGAYTYWISGQAIFRAIPDKEQRFNSCFALPLQSGATAADSRTIIVKSYLRNYVVFEASWGGGYEDVTDSSTPSNNWAGNIVENLFPTTLFASPLSTDESPDWYDYVNGSPIFGPLDYIDTNIGRVDTNYRLYICEHSGSFSVFPNSGSPYADIIFPTKQQLTLDIECYLATNTSISKIDCPEILRDVISSTFETETLSVDVYLGKPANVAGIDQWIYRQEPREYEWINLKDGNFWSTTTGQKKPMLADTALLRQETTTFQSSRNVFVYTPEIYSRLLEYNEYTTSLPESRYLSTSWPTIDTRSGGFSNLYSYDTRTSSGPSADSPYYIGFSSPIVYSYYSGGPYKFMYRTLGKDFGYRPLSGPSYPDELQGLEGEELESSGFLPSVHLIESVDEPAVDFFELHGNFAGFSSQSLILSWTGGNDDYCITMARALGFPREVTGLTYSEQQDETPPAE